MNPFAFGLVGREDTPVTPLRELLRSCFTRQGDRIILSVRPGITGPATLKYRDEEALLAAQNDPEQYNNEVLWPDKVRLNREYVENWSFWGDIRIILKTLKII